MGEEVRSLLTKKLEQAAADMEDIYNRVLNMRTQRDELLAAARALLAENPYSPSIVRVRALEAAVGKCCDVLLQPNKE